MTFSCFNEVSGFLEKDGSRAPQFSIAAQKNQGVKAQKLKGR